MPISDTMRRFILNSIPSIPYLEAILLMRNENATQWGIAELAKRLFIDEKRTESILSQLHSVGVIIMTNSEPRLYQYHPQDEYLKNTIDELAITYSSNLVEVTNLIHSNIEQKANQFANAFLWRKDS